MDKTCYYKQVSGELSTNEYKILADMIRLFYNSKEKLEEMYQTNKISEECYNYFLKNFPVKKYKDIGYHSFLKTNETYVFPNRIEEFPIEFTYTKDNDIIMKMSDDKYITVEIIPDTYPPTDKQYDYVVGETDRDEEYKEEVVRKKYFYKNNKLVYLETIRKYYRTYEDNEIIREQSHDYVFTTFKETGSQREEWRGYDYKSRKDFYFREREYRENYLPSIIDEDGTQIWTTIPENSVSEADLNKLKNSDDPYYKKYQQFNLYIDHPDDLPAVIKPDGTEIFYKNGKASSSIAKAHALLKNDPYELKHSSDFFQRLKIYLDE